MCGDQADPAVRSGVPHPTLLQGAHTSSVQDLLRVPCIRSLLYTHLQHQVPHSISGIPVLSASWGEANAVCAQVTRACHSLTWGFVFLNAI